MSNGSKDFTTFWKQLYSELQSLSSEAKKRNSSIKQASDKSIEILKTTHTYEELSRHPDFVLPFVMSCSSNNAKLTTISMQCLQGLASTPCIPKGRLPMVLDGFMDASQLALEIKLKILQVLPIFFKNYSRYICGPLCAKLLRSCSNLLAIPNKSSMVIGTASATLQQLIDEIFERLLNQNDVEKELHDDEEFDVLVANNESIKVNAYRYDANRLFSDLCSSFDIADSQDLANKEPFLDTKNLPITYALEILESILQNGKAIFLENRDMQFLLRIKTVPFLLRCISSGKHFSVVLRSFRCINLLMNKDYILILELEMEVILSLLIHAISAGSESPLWKRTLSLEIFVNITQNFNLVEEIFMTYDNFPDKKHVVTNLLTELLASLSEEDISNCLCESNVIEKLDQAIVSTDILPTKIQYIHMLDKSSAPPVNITYVIWLVLTISNEISDGLSVAALNISQSTENPSMPNNLEKLTQIYKGVFEGLLKIHEKFLYSTSLDTPLFHSLIRAFQKLAHAAGILTLSVELNQCLKVFSVAIITNKDSNNWGKKDQEKQQNIVFDTLNGSLTGSVATGRTSPEELSRNIFPSRNIKQRQISLFRALISLSVSLGPNLIAENWSYILRTWQWISYYVYGPSSDIMEGFYAQDVPPAPQMTKNEVLSIENSIVKLFESTITYGNRPFKVLVEQFISESQNCFSEVIPNNDEDLPNLETSVENSIYSCKCNRLFYVTELGELTTYNSSRFFGDQKSKETISVAINYLIMLIADRKLPSITIRLYAAKTLTDIIRKVCFEVGGIEEQDLRANKFHILEGVILDSILNCIVALKELKVTKNTIHNGVVKAESEILLQLLSTLKDILNEFGDIISTSWPSVFLIVNSPFDWLKKDLDDVLIDDEDGSSLINGIILKYKDIIQVSYDVFKLISDDFLQNLPIGVIKIVVDTLLNFVTQEVNLNISFSSISQFWLIGDYLRLQRDNLSEDDRGTQETEFLDDIKEGRLKEVLSSQDTSAYKMYNGLWLYLLKALIECTEDKRPEVKNGAVQTFFRIVDSHGALFPNWELIYIEVIKPLLSNRWDAKEQVIDADFWNHIFKGLVDLYPLHFSNFLLNSSSTEQWIMLLDFLESYLSSDSNEIAYFAIINYRTLLMSMLHLEHIPKPVLIKIRNIWSHYNIIYSDVTLNSGLQKSGYDCIQEFISGFPYLYDIMMKYEGITVEFLEGTLSLFNSAVRYPLLPENVRDKTKPTSLQLSVLNGINTFSQPQKGDIEVLVLFQLSMIITLPFDTREKIEKKLLPKLPSSSRSRIPTFEAVSIFAFEALKNRLGGIQDWSFLTEKHTIKIMNNLGTVINRKPLFDGMKTEDEPIWISISRCFREISIKIFESSPSQETEILESDFLDIFINVSSSILRRIDAVTDRKTEHADVVEYTSYKNILLRPEIIKFMKRDQLEKFIIGIWECSFLYEFDKLENEIRGNCDSLLLLASNLTNFEFSDIAGSTAETSVLSKYSCSITCLKDLISFVKISGECYKDLHDLCAPYLVCRVAFALRRHISNESLVRRAPIPKVRKIELEILLSGLHDILELSFLEENVIDTSILSSIKILHPLILRTIQFSYKLDISQNDVLQLSLGFTKLISK